MTRESLFALRHEIARIEGRLAERLDATEADARTLLRRAGVAAPGVLATGIERLDAGLGGGVPLGALTEIHSTETRDMGAAVGFALALAGMALRRNAAGPVVWIATSDAFREAGLPYAPGLAAGFGVGPGELLISALPGVEDALRAAEEAAAVPVFAAVILELRGNPRALDLTATRRLQHRAQEMGHPLLLLRQAAMAEPTAAPLRLLVSPAPAGLRRTVAGPLPLSIGAPAFRVGIGRSRTGLTGQFLLEWNRDDFSFQERRAEDALPLVSLSGDGAGLARPAGTVVAFPPPSAAGGQPPRPQRPTHLRAGRTG